MGAAPLAFDLKDVEKTIWPIDFLDENYKLSQFSEMAPAISGILFWCVPSHIGFKGVRGAKGCGFRVLLV